MLDNTKIADDMEKEQVLRGIQPRNQSAFKFFRITKVLSVLAFLLNTLLFGLIFVEKFDFITKHIYYKYLILLVGTATILFLVLALLTRVLFLRKAPFDDWVFEIAENMLGTTIIFYDRKRIYIEYRRTSTELTKEEFVSFMSDKSLKYNYFLLETDIDAGYLIVLCKKRQPIPDKVFVNEEDTKYWNYVPLGVARNNTTLKLSSIGWYMNDQLTYENSIETVPSTSMMIVGGTGCHGAGFEVQMYNNLVEFSEEDLSRFNKLKEQ